MKSVRQVGNPRFAVAIFRSAIMPKFMLVYRSQPYDASEISPEAMQEVMKVWNSWIGEGFAKGWMVDPGDALMPEGKIVNMAKLVTDGPFIESKELVGGYSIVKTDTLAEAVEIAKTCPALSDDSATIEVRKLAELSNPG
jgi:hypothetical protein